MADQVYDGFVSYSHAADDLLAPRLQAGLQRFAKPWWKRRALRVFRDESSLSANPHLWFSITEALNQSSWFVLLLSPEAAQSEWVNQEIEYWKAHNDLSRILPVLTDGTFEWFGGDVSGTAVPEQLQDTFSEEPRWVDMRFARDETDLDLKDPRFADAVADIASAIRGIPKDELASEEVKQHRRTIRTAWAAAGLVALLAVAATVFGVQSARNAAEAEANAERADLKTLEAEQNAAEAEAQAADAEQERQAADQARAEAERQAVLAKSRELGASAVEALEAGQNPKLAALLALESLLLAGSLDEQPDTLVDTLFRSVLEDRLVRVIDIGVTGLNHIAISPDGTLLASSAEKGPGIVMYAVPDGDVLWRYEEDTSDTYTLPWFSPDGSMVAVAVADSGAYDVKGLPPDDLPNRLLLLDVASGHEIRRIDLSPCGASDSWGWSPDGEVFAITNGQTPCPREDAPDSTWVELLDGSTLEPQILLDAADPFMGPRVEFSEDGDLYLFGFEEPLEVLQAPDYLESTVVESVEGYTDVAPDGSHAVTFSPSTPERLAIVDLTTHERTDILRPLESNPSLPLGVGFSPDSSRVIVQTESEGTLVWDVTTGRQVFDLPSGPRGNAQTTVDGLHLYTTHADGTIKIWNLAPITVGQTVVGDLEGFDFVNANSFAVSGDFGAAQAISFTGEPSSRIVLFDPDSGQVTGTLDGTLGRPDSLSDGRFLLHTDRGEVAVYNAETESLTPVAGCPSLDDEPPFFCEDTGEEQIWINYVVSLDRSKVLLLPESEPATYKLLDSKTLDLLEEGPWEFTELDWVLTFTDEWTAGIGTGGSPLLVLDRDTEEEIARFVDCGCRPEFSTSGRWYANPFDSALVLIDLENWSLNRYELGLGAIRGVEFSPDESVIALGDQTEMVFVEVATGEVLRRIPIGDASDFHWIDDQTLLFANRDGLWATVTLDPIALAQETLDNLTRGFTSDECERFGIEPCPNSLDAVRQRYARVGS